MSNKLQVAFSTFILVIYISCIVFFIANININHKQGSQQAEQNFTNLLNKIKENKENEPFLSAVYTESIKNYLQKNDSIAAISFKTESKTIFAYPINSTFFELDANNEPAISVSSSMIKVYSTSISIFNPYDTTITAAIYTLNPLVIYSSGKIIFIIILSATILSIVLLVFTAIKKKEPQISTNSVDIPKPLDTQAKVDDTIYIEKENPVDEIKPVSTPLKSPAYSEIKSNYDKMQRIDPMGLFSPNTGLGWESYLETRLDAELIRAASNEQDLAFVLIQIRGLPHTHPTAKIVANIILEYFKFRDLIFEFQTDSYAAIQQDMGLDKAMVLCEKLYSELHEALISLNDTVKIGIGLSTRTLRLIPGARIIKEATQAIEKSFEEQELPIVAFKVNAEKYRKYLTEEISHSQYL